MLSAVRYEKYSANEKTPAMHHVGYAEVIFVVVVVLGGGGGCQCMDFLHIDLQLLRLVRTRRWLDILFGV